MRIRKRSIAALSSSSWEKPGRFTLEEEAAAAKEKEFLFPLVAAVVDIQAKARFYEQDCAITPTARRATAGIHTRPVHKWRNALLRRNAETKALQVTFRSRILFDFGFPCLSYVCAFPPRLEYIMLLSIRHTCPRDFSQEIGSMY